MLGCGQGPLAWYKFPCSGKSSVSSLLLQSQQKHMQKAGHLHFSHICFGATTFHPGDLGSPPCPPCIYLTQTPAG
jgi:hypothetical protein